MTKTKSSEKEKLILTAQPRNLFGRKVRRLRAAGIIPANVYGAQFKSQSVSVNLKDFIKIYKIAKETGVIYLTISNQEIPVLIEGMQKNPIDNSILHVVFRKIDLTKKLEKNVPIKIIGESRAVKELGGVLLTQLDSLIIEALPQDIPQFIEVDITSLKEIGQEIKVADISSKNNYLIKTPAERVIVSVIAHKEESTTPETTTTPAEVISENKVEKEETPQQDSTQQQTTDKKNK